MENTRPQNVAPCMAHLKDVIMNGYTLEFFHRIYGFSIYDEHKHEDPVICSAVWIGKARKL